jgi:hypothetical protein
MTTYAAKSLTDLAAFFDEMASRQMARSETASRIKDQIALDAEARTWRQAAQVLRETTLTPSEPA